MAFEKLNLKKDDLLDEAVFKKIDDNFESINNTANTIFTDLYDEKIDTEYELIERTASMTNPTYANSWNYSTFSGWAACIGKPQNFDRVRFRIQTRTDYPITLINLKIWELPDASEVTADNYGLTPVPTSWKLLGQTKVSFDQSPEVGKYHIITADFDETIVNADGKYLVMGIFCNNYVTMGLVKCTYDDIPYNPWTYYAIEGRNGLSKLASGTYTYASKEVYCHVADFYKKLTSEPYTTIGTSKKDKFFTLVEEAINNSESFGEIFQQKWKSYHQIGTQDLSSNKTPSSVSTHNSNFSGVIFPVGDISADYEFDGCSILTQATSYNSSTDPITEVYAYLYEVDTIPDYIKNYEFTDLNPVLVRSGTGVCNIPIGESGVCCIPWDEGPYKNENGKFLMLGYNTNTYSCRCHANSTGVAAIKKLTGKSYSDIKYFDTWYSTARTKSSASQWRRHWNDYTTNAWSLGNVVRYYDLGEKFYTLLDSAIDEVLSESSIDTEIPPTSEIRLAKQYDLVVGDTFQLYYDGVVKAFDPSREGITVRCSVGKEYTRYWEYTPQSTGTYTLKLYTRQLDGTIISEGSTTIKVHPKLTNDTTPSNLNVLVFGDSLTSTGCWAAEGLRRIYGATDSSASGPASLGVTNTVTTYGSKKHTINTFPIRHEGYGGWTWNSFLTAERGDDSTTNGIVVTLSSAHGYVLDTVQKSIWTDNNGLLWELEDFPSDTQIKFNRGTGNSATQANTANPTSLSCDVYGLSITPTAVVWETTNPFYDEATTSLNFNAHAAQYGVDSADIVTCLLTWNGANAMNMDFNNETIIANHMGNATEMFRAIHEDFPNAKIIAMGIQISSLTGGAGHSCSSCNGRYSDTWASAFYAFDYNKALENLCASDEFKSYVYYVDTKGQFDTVNMMPYVEVAVNPRLPDVKEKRGSNGLHPTTAGYYMIGDAFYRALTKVIPIIAAEKAASN